MSDEHADAAAELAAALAEVERLNDQAAADAGDEAAAPGAALVPAGGGLPAEEVKAAMIAARSAAASTARELEAAKARVREVIERQKRQAEAMLADVSAALEPLQRRVALMQDGIQAINLYIGTGEELVMLAEGEPAPAGEPIRVWQTVLAMDEESALFAESGGIDHLGVPQFDGWVTADWARVEQLIPAQRGVVAIMPRRSRKDYGDSWANQARNEANRATYLLIRNGRCLYRYIAEDFNVGPRLVPARDEFTGYFETRRYDMTTGGFKTVRIEPGTREWDRAEHAAGTQQRHFMKIALVLQGLIDRTACFHPLPAPGLSLLHGEAYEAGHIILITDDENALTTGRVPFADWLADRNKQLRPGMRVAGNFRGEAWQGADHSDDRRGYWRHSRLHPQGASHPETGRVYTIERRGGDGALMFMFERTDEVYKRDVPVPGRPGWVYSGPMPVPATQRASCRIYPQDRFIIPVDLVTIAECEAYLASRADRHAYLDMFPILKAVIKAKREEAEAEAPMRQLLAAAIVEAHGVTYAEAEEAVPGLVDWWKLANRWHRPLVTGGDPKAEKRAIDAVVREFAARRNAVTDDTETETAALIRTLVADVMLVARKRDGSWIALAGQPRRWHGEPGRVWVREHTWTKTLAGHRTRDWVLPEPSRVARWRVLWTGAAWDERDQAATAADHLADPDIDAITEAALLVAAGQAREPFRQFRNSDPEGPLGGRALAVEHRVAAGSSGHRFTVWWLTARPGREHGVEVAELHMRWRRTTGGEITTEHGELYPREWTRKPWDARNPLTFTDPDAIGDFEQAIANHEAAEKERRRLQSAAYTLQNSIAAQWTDAAREAARVKFVGQYGDPDLWEDHAKGMRFDCPHAGHRGWEKPWENAVERLVLAGADLAGMSVAEMAAAHEVLFGEAVEVPDDIAGYRFPGSGGPQA